jgi:hypothetical protein
MKDLLFLIFFLALSFSKNSWGFRFIDGLEDIPVFKDMKYVEDSLVLFDKIDGRYVSSELIGEYNKEEISEFYNNILPNLGWRKFETLRFKRGNEILEIKFKETDNKISATFSISPKN